MSKVQIIWKSIGLSITAVLLVSAAILGFRLTPTAVPCVSLRYTIEDADERMYLTEEELNTLLRAEGIYPVGRSMNAVSMHRIENAVLRHPMVRTAECYMTPRSEVRVCLTQRVPLLRVQTHHEHYLIDTDRRVMQARAVVRDSVPIVVGNISPQTAATQLADYAEWLQGHRYWRTRVQYLYIQSPYTTYAYMREEGFPRVALGSLRGYERKFAKLRTYVEQGGEETAGKQYRELDLRFKGQVIGRK